MFQQASPLLTKQNVRVEADGENVFWWIGNTPIVMHYEHAFDVSRWMRAEAGAIKQAMGYGKTSRSLGVMHDAEAKPKRLAPRQRGPAIHVKPKPYQWDRRDVSTVGNRVSVKIGTHAAAVHFREALTLSQWIRVRAKQARNTVGDTRHWSEIGKECD